MRSLALTVLLGLAAPASAQTFTDSLARADYTITSGEYADEYALTLDPGRTLTADLRSPDFDTYLILISPSGEQIDNDDWDDEDIGHSRVEVPEAEPGTWRLLVTSVAVGETGAYTLVVDTALRGAAPAPTPPVSVQAGMAPSAANPDAPPPAASDPLRGGAVDPAQGGYGWVLGSASREAAEARAARYRQTGYRAAMIPGVSQGRTIYRIVVGQFTTRAEAEAARGRLPDDAPRDAWILALE